MVGFINLHSELGAYVLLLRFLDKKGLSIVTKLHVQVHRLAIHFNVNLERIWQKIQSILTLC